MGVSFYCVAPWLPVVEGLALELVACSIVEILWTGRDILLVTLLPLLSFPELLAQAWLPTLWGAQHY